jgi:putative holliday junction resolvase
MRTMGLDVGTRTVGVAISDALGITAQGVTTVRRTNLRTDLAALRELVTSHEVGLLVVGLPLNMDGTEGERARASRAFGDAVGKATGLPVEYQDERLSTVAAQRVLLEADLSRHKRKQVVDQVAAQFILQAWMDRQPGGGWSDDDGPGG